MLFRIARSINGSRIEHYDLYKVKTTKGMTVLDALFRIQDTMDPSLSFRYSCRGAVCGSCAMLIDKVPRLACRTQIDLLKKESLRLEPFSSLSDIPRGWNRDTEILVEPLPNFPILNDLIVDLTKFYQALDKMKLWEDPTEDGKPRHQLPEDQEKIRRYVNCIMCALCFGSCPVNADHDEYLGPASLAKSWRFHEDSRISTPSRYLDDALKPEGAPMCELIMNCVRVCPKGVAPGGAIRRIKEFEK